MQITILVNGLWLAIASADYRFGLVGQVYSYTTRLGLDIDKDNMVFGEHRVSLATNLNLDSTIVDMLNYGNVLLVAGIDCVGNHLLHLLTATNYGYARIYDLLNHIAAMAALIKLCCHNTIFRVKNLNQGDSVNDRDIGARHRDQRSPYPSRV